MSNNPLDPRCRVLTAEERKTVIEMAGQNKGATKIREYLNVDIGTWVRILERDTPLNTDIAHAQQHGLEDLADSLLEITDEYADVQKARLKSDNIKFLLSKRKPAVYGDRIDLNVNGTIDLKAALDQAERRISIPPRDLQNVIEAEVVDIIRSKREETTDYKSDDEGIDPFS